MKEDIKEIFAGLILPIFVCIVALAIVVVLPTYFVYKYECKTFAELQQTEFKYTINGTCYLKSPSGKWTTKDMWYFDKAFGE